MYRLLFCFCFVALQKVGGDELRITHREVNSQFELSWERVPVAPFESSLFREYQVQTSADLKEWLPAGERILSAGAVNGETLSVSLQPQAGIAFYRVAATLSLPGADLRGADLREADLRKADMRQADLSGANMTGAELAGANLGLAKVIGLILEKLGGKPETPLAGAVPFLEFHPRPSDYSADHPEIHGLLSFNTFQVVFASSTTVGQANTILETIEGSIAGAIPGSAGVTESVLTIRVPTTNHEELITLLDALRENSQVKYVVQDALLESAGQTRPNAGSPANWTWEAVPSGGNWGLERIRVPQMWNLNDAIAKLGVQVTTAVLDSGFATNHLDLAFGVNLNPTAQAEHGTHVAGTIGADFNNGAGIDGLNPFAKLIVRGTGTNSFSTAWINGSVFQLLTSYPELRLINLSIGYNWSSNPTNSAADMGVASLHGAIFNTVLNLASVFRELPLILTAAGNSSAGAGGWVDSRYGSPIANAALEHGAENILVVEAVADAPGSSLGDATRAPFSNVNGHLSAPGDDITSTFAPGGYGVLSGTSMATPHVTALIGYLYAIERSLTHAQIEEALLGTAVSVAGGASDRIDAFAAVMALDEILETNRVVRLLVDVDDGTLDGNRRSAFDTGADFLLNDVDGDGGPGDGKVDITDFRRWRDWLLQIENAQALLLDGSAAHLKKDLNVNGEVEDSAAENVYPRGDYNGDGKIDRHSQVFVAGAMNAPATDLAMLQLVFNDSHYSADDLDALIDSADLEIWPDVCLAQAGVASIHSSVRIQGSDQIVESRVHTTEDPRQLYTIPVHPNGYTARVETLDSAGTVLSSAEKEFSPMLGSDTLWRPSCASLSIRAVFPEIVERDTPSPLLILVQAASEAGLAPVPGATLEFVVNGGTIASEGGITDQQGYFETTATASSPQITIFITVNAPGYPEQTIIVQAETPPLVQVLHFGSIVEFGAAAKVYRFPRDYLDSRVGTAGATPDTNSLTVAFHHETNLVASAEGTTVNLASVASYHDQFDLDPDAVTVAASISHNAIYHYTIGPGNMRVDAESQITASLIFRFRVSGSPLAFTFRGDSVGYQNRVELFGPGGVIFSEDSTDNASTLEASGVLQPSFAEYRLNFILFLRGAGRTVDYAQSSELEFRLEPLE